MHLQNKIICDNIQNKNKKKLFISIIFIKYDIIQHIFSLTNPSLNQNGLDFATKKRNVKNESIIAASLFLVFHVH